MTQVASAAPLFSRENVTDALNFWESGRVAYNIVLAAATLWLLSVGAGGDKFDTPSVAELMPLEGWLGLVLLAALANLLYCAAYPVDLFIQASDWRKGRWTWRITLWAFGTGLALTLAALTFLPLVKRALAFAA